MLQTEGYTVYRSLADPTRAGGPIAIAFYWALPTAVLRHRQNSPGAIAIATETLKRIAKLYEI